MLRLRRVDHRVAGVPIIAQLDGRADDANGRVGAVDGDALASTLAVGHAVVAHGRRGVEHVPDDDETHLRGAVEGRDGRVDGGRDGVDERGAEIRVRAVGHQRGAAGRRERRQGGDDEREQELAHPVSPFLWSVHLSHGEVDIIIIQLKLSHVKR